jgi:hypothetical protein
VLVVGEAETSVTDGREDLVDGLHSATVRTDVEFADVLHSRDERGYVVGREERVEDGGVNTPHPVIDTDRQAAYKQVVLDLRVLKHGEEVDVGNNRREMLL